MNINSKGFIKIAEAFHKAQTLHRLIVEDMGLLNKVDTK